MSDMSSKKIGIIGTGFTGKTMFEQAELEAKTIQEIIADQNTLPFTANRYSYDLDEPISLEYKDGKQLRRERRAKERKTKK